MTTKLKSLSILFLVLLSSSLYSQDKYPFEVKISGHGEQTLIFIPGFASSGAVWNESLEKFETQFTCYTLTMAGFAGVPPQPNITFDHWKSEIARYLTSQKITQPILVGHSMGGALTLAIAADYPDLISKIVVVDALPALAALSNPDFKADDNLDCSAGVTQFTDMSDDSFYAMQKNSLPMMLQNADMHETVLNWSIASDRETFAKMYCDFYNTDLREVISNITCPSLILLESYFINFRTAIEAQYQNLKTSHFAYANKGLHFIMFDDKEWYLSQLDQFLSVH